jgi:hypothetical protein
LGTLTNPRHELFAQHLASGSVPDPFDPDRAGVCSCQIQRAARNDPSGPSRMIAQPPKQLLPQYLATIGALPQSKAVVDAEFDSIDGLLDVDPWHHFWETRKRPSECYPARADRLGHVPLDVRPRSHHPRCRSPNWASFFRRPSLRSFDLVAARLGIAAAPFRRASIRFITFVRLCSLGGAIFWPACFGATQPRHRGRLRRAGSPAHECASAI